MSREWGNVPEVYEFDLTLTCVAPSLNLFTMSESPKIDLPLTFEEFNALDILIHAEIAELTASLRAMSATAVEARATVERFLSRLAMTKATVERLRPAGYVEEIRARRSAHA